MRKIAYYFELARTIAKKPTSIRRQFLLGAIGIRTDGVIVGACNIPAINKTPQCHAEYRVTKKLNYDSVVIVIRVNRKGDYCNANPCHNCRRIMKQRGIKRCYYSISNKEYGVWIP